MNMIAPRRSRLVLVGNGMAGVRALEEILARAPHAFSITVFGAESHGSYNRILLSPVLAGEKSFEAITTHPRSWYEENGIELIAGEAVVGIDRDAKTVTGALGTTRPYDVLVLATGSNPVIIPLPGHKLPGVIGFRDIADVETMIGASKAGRHAVVIGGGLLGLEAANGLSRIGMDTTVLHIVPTLMERQLDPVSAELLKADLGAYGVSQTTGCTTTVPGAKAGTCAGHFEAFSFDADYSFNKRFDVYAGAMYSAVYDGVASGYDFQRWNINPTIGARFKF